MRAVIAVLLFLPSAVQARQTFDLQPAVRFEAEPFSRVRGLVELDGRVVLLVDQTENALYRVDLGRGTREQIGRSGAGPGEYENPTGVGPWSGDSLLVSDLGNGRLAVLGPDLAMARTMPMFGEHYSLPSSTDGQGRIYFDLAASLSIERRRGNPVSDSAAVVRWDEPRSRADTIARIFLPVESGPISSRDVWAAGPDGRVAVARNQERLRVDWILPDGRTVTGPVIDEERPSVTDRDVEIWMERHPQGGSSIRMAGEPVRPPRPPQLPDRFPYVTWGGVHVDPDGRAWVVRYQPLTEPRPLIGVFDGSGRRIAQVRLPEGREVIGVGRRGLWAVRVDELGLQWLERYDIPVMTGAGGSR